MDYCENCGQEFDREELTFCHGVFLCEDCEDNYEIEHDLDSFHELDFEDEEDF